MISSTTKSSTLEGEVFEQKKHPTTTTGVKELPFNWQEAYSGGKGNFQGGEISKQQQQKETTITKRNNNIFSGDLREYIK